MDEITVSEEWLVYESEVFINFRTSRQWVVVKLFALPANTDDREVLQLSIRHVRYRDSYASSEFKDSQTIHGPYWLNAITPESFSPVSAADAETLIRTWAEYSVPLTDGDREAMEREVYARIRGASSCYQFADLRETAEHEWGSSVGSNTAFYEFVLIERDTGRVELVVASDD